MKSSLGQRAALLVSLATIAVAALTVGVVTATGETWTRQFGTSARDSASAVAADGIGNIFVGGETEGTFPGETSDGVTGDKDGYLNKFSADGTVVWTRQFGWVNQFGSQEDVKLEGVATDSLGNVYVVGWATKPSHTTTDGFIRKYDANGGLIWTRESASDPVTAIAIASNDEIYLLRGPDLVRFTTDGNEVWSRPPDYLFDATTLAVSDSGIVYVAGRDMEPSAEPAFVYRYSSNGQVLSSWEVSVSPFDYRVLDIALAGNGDVYLTGSKRGGSVVIAVLSKLNSSGALLWDVHFPTEDSEATSVVIGNVGQSIWSAAPTRRFPDSPP